MEKPHIVTKPFNQLQWLMCLSDLLHLDFHLLKAEGRCWDAQFFNRHSRAAATYHHLDRLMTKRVELVLDMHEARERCEARMLCK